MKKRQDHSLNVIRWCLIIFCFGIMLLGFYFTINRNTLQNQNQIIEAEIKPAISNHD